MNGPSLVTHPPHAPDGAALISAIGQAHLGRELALVLHRACGADHCSAFRVGDDTLQALAAGSAGPSATAERCIEHYFHREWWRRDPALDEARQRARGQRASLVRVDLGAACYVGIRQIVYPDVRDRLLLCGQHRQGTFGLSVLRSHPHAEFDPEALERLAGMADLLLAVLAKHASLREHPPMPTRPLGSLPDIQACLQARSELPRRESEVCSRMLYGMSSEGMAVDLGLALTTVSTYRKRVFRRLNLGNRHELLRWYLALRAGWGVGTA